MTHALALKHIAELLNHCGAAPGCQAGDGGYQPATEFAQGYLIARGGGWADGAGWLPPAAYLETPVCSQCGTRFVGDAGPCEGSDPRIVEGLPLHSIERLTWNDRVTAVVDEAHAENLGGEHREGFCKACANAYLVAQRAVPGGPGQS